LIQELGRPSGAKNRSTPHQKKLLDAALAAWITGKMELSSESSLSGEPTYMHSMLKPGTAIPILENKAE
jgi:hypothetical protein